PALFKLVRAGARRAIRMTMMAMTTMSSIKVKPKVGGRGSEISHLRPCADECGGENGECRARVDPAMVGCVTGMWGKWSEGSIKSMFSIEKASKKQAVFRI